MSEKRKYCVVSERWCLGKTIDQAYIDQTVGPFSSRALAEKWARLHRKRPNTAATVFVLRPCCEDCIE